MSLDSTRALVSISIIIPAYNEQHRIDATLKRLQSYCTNSNWDFEIVVVEDGSTDNTANIVDGYHLLDERITLLSLPVHVGKGGSIAVAALHSTKEYIAYLDADLAADISELDPLIHHMDMHDMVIGSRILRGNLPRVKRPIYRFLLSSLYSKAFRTLFRIPIYDPQCGVKIFKSAVLRALVKNIICSGFAFDTNLIVEAYSLSMRVKEIPIEWIHRESSKLSIFREIRRMGLDLLSIWYIYHLKWKNGETSYPQKKGSIYARCLFSIISHIESVRTLPKKYLEYREFLERASLTEHAMTTLETPAADLQGPTNGKTMTDLQSAINALKVHVDLQTKNHPDGELRGTIRIQDS